MSQNTSQCFYPNKYPSNDVPCDTSAEISACCNADSICLNNGLCLSETTVSRGSCTSEEWGPPCAEVCLDRNPGGGMAIMPCLADPDDWNWFTCGVGATCNDTNQFQLEGQSEIVLRKSQVANLGYTSAVNVSASTVLNVTGSTETSTPSVNSNKKYSAAEMAGVGVGVGIPLLIALLGAMVVIFRQRKRLNDAMNTAAAGVDKPNPPFTPNDNTWYSDHQLMPVPAYKPSDGYGGGPQSRQSQVRELDTAGYVGELDTSSNAQELSAKPSVQLPNVKPPAI